MDALIQNKTKGWKSHPSADSAQRLPLVLGAGLPRTGTSSTFEALNILGLGPVMHMAVNFQQPWRLDVWRKALLAKRQALKEGELRLAAHDHHGPAELPEWSTFLKGYGATLDSPACEFIPELMEAFPEAKVVLTVRDSDEVWWKSYFTTVGVTCENQSFYRQKVYLISTLYKQACLGTELSSYWAQRYCAEAGQRTSGLVHSRHNDYIKGIVPPEKLLVFNVKQGWKPLCEFLGVPVREVPFPNVNDTTAINRILGAFQTVGMLLWAATLGGSAALFFFSLKLIARRGSIIAAFQKVLKRQ
jgi:hypothetical protein